MSETYTSKNVKRNMHNDSDKSGPSYFLGKFPLLLAHSKFRAKEASARGDPGPGFGFKPINLFARV